MDISLIVSTRDRAGTLGCHLESLEKLTSPVPFEIILVNNGSVDNTSQLLQQFRETSTHNVIVIEEPRVGVSKARNHGASIAKGHIIAFTDDDCYPEPGYLHAIYETFQANPRLGFTGGRVLLHDPDDSNTTIQVRDAIMEIRPGSFIEAGFIHGANFAFRQEAFVAAGGFDERFGCGAEFSSAEDVDLMTRVSCLGWWGIYHPAPTVYHHHRRKTREDNLPIKKRNNRGRGAYFAKCLMVPTVRKACLSHWMWRIKCRPVMEIYHELIAALDYFLKTGGSRFRF